MKKTSLELQHIDYFLEKGSILFYDVFTESKLHQFKMALCFFNQRSARNCWVQQEQIKKLTLNPTLCSIALQLSQKKSLRLGFDHLFASLKELKEFFKPELPLSKMSSIDGLEIGVLLNLSLAAAPESYETSFPLASASGCFFNPQKPLDLAHIEQAEGPFFLITYCRPNARYIHQAEDPFTHQGKQEGSVFGDLLAPHRHPLLHTH